MHSLSPIVILLAACTEYDLTKPTSELPGDPVDTGEPEPEPEPEPDTSTDTWDLDEVGGVDVLFFGDTSGSMAVELETLGAQVITFVERLTTYTDDWQLLAVTGPDGCGQQGVLDASVPDYADRFAQGITTPPGEDLVDEWGLYNALRATEAATDKGCNAGFLRDDARLHVIFISDEDDNSPGWDSGDEDYWRPYYDDIVAKKSDPEQVVFSGIIGPIPDGCSGAEPGHGYAEAVAESEGQLLPICDNWQDSITLLVDASVAYPLFHLSDAPVEGTIQVTVDGTLRTDGWRHEPLRNVILFTENVPILGQTVAVSYETVE